MLWISLHSNTLHDPESQYILISWRLKTKVRTINPPLSDHVPICFRHGKVRLEFCIGLLAALRIEITRDLWSHDIWRLAMTESFLRSDLELSSNSTETRLSKLWKCRNYYDLLPPSLSHHMRWYLDEIQAEFWSHWSPNSAFHHVGFKFVPGSHERGGSGWYWGLSRMVSSDLFSGSSMYISIAPT